jgi:hypothetical protein
LEAVEIVPPAFSLSFSMDSFDNFQYDSASSYGGIGIVDDTSSVYTANTQDNASSVDLSGLSISEYSSTGNGHAQSHPMQNGLDEDFDAVLDDLKDEGAVDLPPHACRYVSSLELKLSWLSNHLSVPAIAAYTRQRQ